MTESLNHFDATKQPLLAIAELIVTCEGLFGEAEDQATLERAQVALTTLRSLFGDDRPNEVIATDGTIEPTTEQIELLRLYNRTKRNVVSRRLTVEEYNAMTAREAADYEALRTARAQAEELRIREWGK